MKLKFPEGLTKEQRIREEAEIVQAVWMCVTMFDRHVVAESLVQDNKKLSKKAQAISSKMYSLFNELTNLPEHD